MTRLRALTMPKWGIEMTEGTLAEWRIKPGDNVTKGQIIAVVETDKIANELECEYDAVVARILASEAEIYPVGALLAVLAETPAAEQEVEEFIHEFGSRSGAVAAAPVPTITTRPAGAPSAAETQEQPTSTIPSDIAISPAARRLALQRQVDVTKIRGSGPGSRITYQDIDQASKPEVRRTPASAVTIAPTTSHLEGIFASAYAKRLAAHHAVDITSLTGTGPRGRIGRQDVLKAIGGGTPATGKVAGSDGTRQQPQVVRMSPMRKAIARQVTLAKSTIPHFYLRAVVRVDSLLALRARAKQESAEAATLNDYFLRAAALALREVPEINVQVHEDAIHRFEHADIAFAVSTEKVLVTPIIRAADTKSVAMIAAESRLLAERGRDGRLRAPDLEGGTFTVSNLGMFGIDQFDAIIVPPQGAILAIGAARRQMIPGDHAWEQATGVNLTLSCDHRAIDGAAGARFMSALRALIENPQRL